MTETESPDMPPLFEGLLAQDKGKMGYEDKEDNADLDLLNLDMDDEEEKENFLLSPAKQSRLPSTKESDPQVDSNLHEVCKQAAAKLLSGQKFQRG